MYVKGKIDSLRRHCPDQVMGVISASKKTKHPFVYISGANIENISQEPNYFSSRAVNIDSPAAKT